MEYKYYRELKHNYLIAKNNGLNKDSYDSYQVRIVKNGKLRGFVPCDIRTINNEYFIYYEINSLQSIKDRFSSKGMRSEQLVKLFDGLKTALEGLSEYLLGIENVVLDTGSIFTDLNTGEFFFLYCPFRDGEKGFSSFIDELFDLVDHEDETAVEMVYTCSENAQMDGMLELDLIKRMTESTKPEAVEETVVPTKEFEIRSEELPKEEFEEDFCDEDYQPVRSGIKKHNIGKKDLGGKAQILFSFLFFALLAAMVFIRMNFILSDEENILSIIVMLVSTVTGIVAFLSGIKDYSAGSKKLFSKAEKEDMEAYNEIGDTDGFDDSDISDAKEYSFGAADNSWDTFEDHEENIDITTYKRPISISSGLRASDETVVLDMDEDCDREVTLYSRNTDKTLRICLSKLPLTIGKLEGCVDNVISDKSISRIHCRFSRNEEGRIVLTDLNSTNGTFKNGLRLKAQEENYIEEGDEIRIGRICFDCR